MSNDMIRRQMGATAGQDSASDDEGGLPWLEPAPEPDRSTLSFKSLAVIGTIFLLVFAALLGVFYNRIAGDGSGGAGSGGEPTLITAPSGPYKISPEEDARRNLAYDDAKPEKIGPPKFADDAERPLAGAEQIESTPVVVEQEPPAPEPAAPQKTVEEPVRIAAVPKKEEPVAPATPKPAPAGNAAPATSGYMLQLGAFSTRESATNGWKLISGKYPGSLAGLSPNVEPFQTSSKKTLYRLRAAALPTRTQADARCAGLKAAKQACFVVSPQ